METVIELILMLALVDFILTVLWIYRWQSSKFLKKFKRRIPIKDIEANPIIRHIIEKFGLYPGVVLGYLIVLIIQIALAKLHYVVAWIVVAVLILAIISHIVNNTTTNKYIEKLTKKYNSILETKKTGGKK